MADRPITIIPPTIERVLDGRCTILRRPSGMLGTCQPGDRLWIREPFRLPRAFDYLSPSLAIADGAQPHFGTDPVDGVGRPRFARELPRAAHRAHLLVTDVHRQALHDVSEDELAAAGFESIRAFASHWTAGTRMGRRDNSWDLNPEVLVLTVQCVRSPLALPDIQKVPSHVSN